ncbi:flagellar biosynthesis protein FlhA [Hahella sp. CCB-MM4]|uniref:flagellar biosynthesis protein FlhA n=1 Tax=Hahella sp. (strain CCB-MM4) TaxID=1926491 RepID=UPI000B9C5C08|nr:flagellar biosynthesis protein FlhA [Hahella sp. CCB-MM4]OZG74854.1 flagellar biosynthesis protein FlhA [Hahella sp. CCB-MM4]
MSSTKTSFSTFLGTRSEFSLVLGMVGILLVLFTPIPSQLLDFLLITNFSFGLMLLLLTFFVDKPLGFSTFPSLLLIATLFRLSLNIAATRLILSEGDAGNVINAVGTYVVGGNYVIGLVVFLILIVVQYVVVTSGAQRVAEVAARFTLDSMPGKQMSIDADMNMGLINEIEARERRQTIEKEASFYGAMDGASKFVKGDAIAGILIILIDIIGGLTIGVAQMDLSWSDALHTYTLLTVGDGIVTQIPALVISTATGIIITRAATDAHLGSEISNQITQYPKTLVIVVLGLLLLLSLPAIPLFPVLAVATIFGSLAFFAYKKNSTQMDVVEEQSEDEEKSLYEELKVEPIEVALGSDIITFFGENEGKLMDEIDRFRKQFAFELGLVLPKVKIIQDGASKSNAYKICLHGVCVANGELIADRLLAISAHDMGDKLPGIKALDPTYGLPAVWISESEADLAKSLNCTLVDPLTVLLTHFSEALRGKAPVLISRSESEKLMMRVRVAQPTLYDDLIPNTLTLSDIQRILQNLLAERVSIRNIELIAETLVDVGKRVKDHVQLTELVRQKLGAEICQKLVSQDNFLYVISFDPGVEQVFQSGLKVTEEGGSLFVDPKLTEQVLTKLAKLVEQMMADGLEPVLISSPSLRPHLKKLTTRLLPGLSVLSLSEIPSGLNIKSFGIVELERGLLGSGENRYEKRNER